MSAQALAPTAKERTLEHLRELIEALDRRVPQIESAGELQIAREAAEVRDKALRRIHEIEAEAAHKALGVTK
jgi:hypothetical protein